MYAQEAQPGGSCLKSGGSRDRERLSDRSRETEREVQTGHPENRK